MTKSKIVIIPLVWMFIISSTISAQQIATKAEIYDFEVGDIFHYKDFGNYGGGQDGFLKWINDTIVDKYYSENNDTLFYTVKRNSMETSAWNPNWTYESFTYTKTITNLDALINNGNIDTVYSGPNAFNGRLINKQEYIEYYGTGYVQDSTAHVNKWVIGCGIVLKWNEDFPFWNQEEFRLLYYKKGDEEWGEEVIIVNTIENPQGKIKVYPNPATEYLNFEFPNNQVNNITIELTSIDGTVQFKKRFQYNITNRIYVGELDKGIYILSLHTDNYSIRKKIIKK